MSSSAATAGCSHIARGGVDRYAWRMCRNIKSLHNYQPPATESEIRDASLQYVRKISGSTKPSHANEAAFDRAVEEITGATTRLLDELVTSAAPKNRELEAAKRRARASERFAA
jgi:hypothetical protein